MATAAASSEPRPCSSRNPPAMARSSSWASTRHGVGAAAWKTFTTTVSGAKSHAGCPTSATWPPANACAYSSTRNARNPATRSRSTPTPSNPMAHRCATAACQSTSHHPTDAANASASRNWNRPGVPSADASKSTNPAPGNSASPTTTTNPTRSKRASSPKDRKSKKPDNPRARKS